MKKGYTIVQMVGAVLLLVGAMLQITRWEVSPYLYTLGAVMFAYVQVMSRYEGKNLIVNRLRRQVADFLLVFTPLNKTVLIQKNVNQQKHTDGNQVFMLSD